MTTQTCHGNSRKAKTAFEFTFVSIKEDWSKRAQMFAPPLIKLFLVLLEDSEKPPNWLDKVSSSKVLKQNITQRKHRLYPVLCPMACPRQDMVTYSKYQVDNGAFKLEIKDAADQYPEQKATFGLNRFRRIDFRKAHQWFNSYWLHRVRRSGWFSRLAG